VLGRGEVMRRARIGAAVCLSVALTSACGAHHASQRRSYSVADVKRAFAGEGLPLRSRPKRLGGVLLVLVPKGMSARVFQVMIIKRGGTLDVSVGVGRGAKLINVRNIVVAYDPTAAAAGKVKAAIRRLSQM
jgi:hypothetical protein